MSSPRTIGITPTSTDNDSRSAFLLARFTGIGIEKTRNDWGLRKD
ncbi:hypothetical protein CSC34_4892 [Pseudomonas aeruginosa]|jgi:hypothetical protein|nr:hypothetical protein CSC34_4892 [Pseudomonas aeruginosa]